MSLIIKRTRDMSQLEKDVIKMIWADIKNIPDDQKWRSYEKKFTFEDKKYVVRCTFKLDNMFFTYKKFTISHDTQLIEIPQGMH